MKIFGILLLILTVLLLLLGYLLFRLMVRRSEKPYQPPDVNKVKEEERAGVAFILEEYDRIQKWGYETVRIQTRKGETLCGYFVKAKKPTNKTVLMIHGYRSCNFYEFAHFALMYLEHFGWNVLIADDYAHGQSDGKYIGFGWMDRLDIHKWTDWLVARMGTDSKILLQGCSMGAAAVLTAAGEENLPKQVCGIVADCGFSSLYKFCKDISKKYLHIPLFPIYYIASCYCKLLAGYRYSDVNAAKSAAKIKIPTLIIHGLNDPVTACENANIIFDALKCTKKLWLVPDAGHGQSILYDRKGYENAVGGLMDYLN